MHDMMPQIFRIYAVLDSKRVRDKTIIFAYPMDLTPSQSKQSDSMPTTPEIKQRRTTDKRELTHTSPYTSLAIQLTSLQPRTLSYPAVPCTAEGS